MNKTFNKKIIFSISLLIIIGIAGSAVIVNAQQESEYRKVAATKPPSTQGEKEPGTSKTREETMTGTGKKNAEKFKKLQKEKEAERRAQNTGQREPSEFVPLQEIPGVIDVETAKSPSKFFNGLFKFGIIIAGFLTVVMIAVGGIQYMSTDAIHGKSEGRERITYALMGLLLILFSWILLNTINPDILNFDIFNESSSDSSNYEDNIGTFDGGGGGTFSGGGTSGSF